MNTLEKREDGITFNNIPEMTDQELSEAIAVEVRGWALGMIKDFLSNEYVPCWKDNSGFLMYKAQWHPAFDLNQARECVEHWLKEHGEWDFGVYRRWQDDELHWVVWMTKEIGAEINIETENTNPARAMCEALLQAVREEQ